MWAFIHKWHRKVGITAAFFVMLLVVTGLLLNHTDKLTLQNIYVKNDTLLKWYHIQPKGQIKSFRVEKHWFTQIGSHLYFDQKELAVHIENLFGAVRISDGFVIALDESLLILTLSGEIVEGISGTDGVPAGVISIGLSESGDIVISAAHGSYLADIDSPEWQEYKGSSVIWSDSREIPKDLYEQLLLLYRGKGLPLERLIQDLHSGRILGDAGVLLVDFMAVLFLLLAMSGAWMWFKYR